MAVHNEAYPYVARGGQVRAKRGEHNLRGISGIDFQYVSLSEISLGRKHMMCIFVHVIAGCVLFIS